MLKLSFDNLNGPFKIVNIDNKRMIVLDKKNHMESVVNSYWV